MHTPKSIKLKKKMDNSDEISEIFIKINDFLKDINKNQSSIEKCFQNLKSLINTDLEESNELLFNYYKFLFHNKQASYLKIIGKTDESMVQEKLCRKYEGSEEKYIKSKKKKSEKPEEENKNSNILFDEPPKANEKEIDPELTPEELNKKLEKLSVFLNAGSLDQIKKLFQAIQTMPQNFTQYNMIIVAYSNWRQIYSEYLLGLSEEPEKNQVLIDELNSIGFVFEKQFYLTREKFIEHSVHDINLELKLFDNISRTSEQIKKRYRELSAIFHPDKTNQWLEDEKKMISSKFFSQIIEMKDKLINEIGENNNFTILEENAESYWALALDYRNGYKKEWSKLKLLEKNYILLHTQEELNKMSIYFSKAAYVEYKSCCRVADRKKNLKKQIQYRGKMALCLYVCNDFIDAQLCAIASLKLIMKNSNSPYINYDDLREAEKIFNKVKGIDEFQDENKPKEKTENYEGALIEMGNKSLVVANKIDEGFSFMEKQKYMSNLNENLEIISKKFLVQADKKLVKYVSPQSEILKAHKQANYYEGCGLAVNAVGGLAGAGMVIQGGVNIVAAATGIGFLGPFGIALGLASIGLGFWGGNKLWKEGNKIRAEPIVREKLNKIMMNALSNHENGKYQEFLNELSKEYEKGKRLVKLEKTGDALSCEYIIDELLKHGFRPDGIAYLLNLLGEVLLSGKLKKLGIPDNDLKNEGQKAFYGALNEKLEKATKELDDKVCKMRANSISGYFNRKINNYFGSKIANEFVEDSQSMPFSMRYEEMRNVARINIAIMRILKGDEQELNVAHTLLNEIKKSIEDNFQFVSISKLRLEVLEDFIWIVNGDFEPEETEKKTNVPMILQSLDDKYDDKYLCYLNEQLKLLAEKKMMNEQCEILNKKALYYIGKTKKEKNSMINWKIALDLYKKSLEISEDETKQKNAVLGYAQCLLHLCKYQTMINLLKNKVYLREYSEFWLYLGCAYRKQCNYKKAKEFIVEALRRNSKNIEAIQENEILEKLMNKKESEIVKKYEKNIFNEQTTTHLSNNQKHHEKDFKILAVDGGGVRGIIPAIWLNEIEKYTHRPISQIFDMISGTST